MAAAEGTRIWAFGALELTAPAGAGTKPEGGVWGGVVGKLLRLRGRRGGAAHAQPNESLTLWSCCIISGLQPETLPRVHHRPPGLQR